MKTTLRIARLWAFALATLMVAPLWAGVLTAFAADESVRVVVWDEQQPQQKEAYDNFLGNQIAAYLRSKPGFSVKSVKLDDPKQGLSDDILDQGDVLIWWGHVRHREIKTETAQRIIERIKSGRLSLIALHSAHWSTLFIEAMNERAIADALAKLTPEERRTAKVVPVRPRYELPRRDAPLTPSSHQRKENDKLVVDVQLPSCVFPAFRADGKPSHIKVLLPKHPIAKGLPEKFDLPHTEMYDEPFHVPAPDEVLFEETWDAGERFHSGSIWKIGKGRVFYFRPGHETFAVFKQPEPLKILENASHWLAEQQRQAVKEKP